MLAGKNKYKLIEIERIEGRSCQLLSWYKLEYHWIKVFQANNCSWHELRQKYFGEEQGVLQEEFWIFIGKLCFGCRFLHMNAIMFMPLNSMQLETCLHSKCDVYCMILGLCVSLLSLIYVCETSHNIRVKFTHNRTDHRFFFFSQL
jgi:hypothetical protein